VVSGFVLWRIPWDSNHLTQVRCSCVSWELHILYEMPLASYHVAELHVTETITFDWAYMASFDKLLNRSVLTSGDCVRTDRDHSTEHPTFSLTHSIQFSLWSKYRFILSKNYPQFVETKWFNYFHKSQPQHLCGQLSPLQPLISVCLRLLLVLFFHSISLGKEAGAWIWPLFTIWCRGQEWLSYISTLPYIFMA
jgi:hypothetical protein